MKCTTSPPSLQRWTKCQNRTPAPRITKGRTALATARNHSQRRILPTVRISAQIPKHAHIPSKTGIPIITKAKSGPMGVELRATKSSGNPIAIHTGQNFFTRDSRAAFTIHLKGRNIQLVPNSKPSDYFISQSDACQAQVVVDISRPLHSKPRPKGMPDGSDPIRQHLRKIKSWLSQMRATQGAVLSLTVRI
jgi:hypothetical protein